MRLAAAIWGTLEFEVIVGFQRPADCGPGPAPARGLGWRNRFRGVGRTEREIETLGEGQ